MSQRAERNGGHPSTSGPAADFGASRIAATAIVRDGLFADVAVGWQES